MAQGINSQHQKVSGFGTSAPKKHEGYAADRVPPSMIGSKPGLFKGSKNRSASYSGPSVARGPGRTF